MGIASQNKMRQAAPPAPKVGALNLLVFNTQQDCVIDEFELNSCRIEHLSSGVFPLHGSVRCMIRSNLALAPCRTKQVAQWDCVAGQ